MLVAIIPATVLLFFLALSKIKKSNGVLKGKRLAIEGLILAFALIALTAYLVITTFVSSP